jgi:hypothetical protein
MYGAAALCETLNILVPPVARADIEGVIGLVRSTLGNVVYAAATAQGQALRLDQAINEALQEALAD